MSNNILKFNGTSHYAYIPDGAALSLTDQPATFSMWIKRNSNNIGYIMSKTAGGNAYFNVQIDQLLFKVYFGSETGFWTNSYALDTVMPLNTNLCMQISRTASAINLYVNNVYQTPIVHTYSNAVASSDNNGNLYIGAKNTTEGFGSIEVDDFRVYKSELTSAERAEIYFNGYGAKYGDLHTSKIASWASNCDTGSGTSLEDDTAGTLNGTLSSATIWATGGVPTIPSAAHYILKRGTTIINYLADPLPSTFTTSQDFSSLADGSYNFTLTPISITGQPGTVSDALTLALVSGVPQTYPNAIPSNVFVKATAGGTVKVNFKYTPTDYTPTSFKISYTTDITTIEEDLEATPPVSYSQTINSWEVYETINYVVGREQYSLTSTANWGTNALVAVKIEPTLSTFTKTTTTYYTVIADATAPTINLPDTKIDITQG